LSIQFKENWQETRERFSAWWANESSGRPPIYVTARREKPLINPYPPEPYSDVADRYLNTDKIIANQFEHLCNQELIAEAFPFMTLDLGAGSLALYTGSEPSFNADTLWFLPVMKGLPPDGKIPFDVKNEWYVRHLEMFKAAKEATKDTDIMLCVPDLVEHLDILSSLIGATELFEEFFENPDLVKAACSSLNEHFKTAFDAFNEYCIDKDTGWNAFTAFYICGPGRTAKIQCDLAAMISPKQFREFALEPLREQCQWLDTSLFHLDGPECICHIPALMEINELNAIQWTTGHGNPPSGEEVWYDLYKQVKDAGKSLWIALADYSPDIAIQKADELVRKFGAKGFYFLMPDMTRKEADALILKADREWKC